jgi:hypothetical protein
MFAQAQYVSYIGLMKPTLLTSHVQIGRTYAALRYSGASESRAWTELGLAPRRGRQLEAIFRAPRPGDRSDRERPRFARCAQHVAAVAAVGGFPVLRR